MGRGYIYDSNGHLEEVIDYSCDGQADRYCSKCQKVTPHWLSGVSSKRGYIWRCMVCYAENAEARDIRAN